MDKVLQYAIQQAGAKKAVQPRTNVYAALLIMEETLVNQGFPSLSPWWKDTIREHYASNKRRLVVRVGRRGGKSSTLCRLAVAETLYGNFPVPPGDVGVFAFVSVSKDEALERLNTIEAILKVLGIPFTRKDDEIFLQHLPRKFKVYAANFRTGVGFTGIGLIFDEMARWRDEEGGKNPATEVVRSMSPSIKTMKNARVFMSSSPWSTIDAHHMHYVMGQTELQNVATAATWVANPTITERECRQEEPDEETFLREYAAIPMRAGRSLFFDPLAIDAALVKGEFPRQAQVGEEICVGADFAFRTNHSAIYVAHKSGGLYMPGELNVQKPQPDSPLRPSDICGRFAHIMRRHHANVLMADGHYRESVIEHLQAFNIGFADAPNKKDRVYVRARVLLHQGLAQIPEDANLIRDLKETESRPTAGGGLTILLPKRPSGSHGDAVAAMALAWWQLQGEMILRPPPKKTQEQIEDEEILALENQLREARGDSHDDYILHW